MEAYLHRKHDELRFLDACLDEPSEPSVPKSIDEAIAYKFKLTAAVRAQYDLKDWTATETAWSNCKKSSHGPFEFRYDYQRADLQVVGPSFYDPTPGLEYETVYTSSGMASISALLLALSHVLTRADVVVTPGAYGETLEFIEAYAPYLTIKLHETGGQALAPASGRSILLLDLCASAKEFEACLRLPWDRFQLGIFDSSCVAGGSGKIGRVLRKARKENVPLVMVRSHTKLDSLGVEYGRLGSTTFVRATGDRRWGEPCLGSLPDEVRNAVRLLGGAALPAHFPPFIGKPEYHSLISRRVSNIVRNGRRSACLLQAELGDLAVQTGLAQGLYVLLKRSRPFDEAAARKAASQMSRDLRECGFPIRHAGSFGFDFAATEWFHDKTSDDFSVRIAAADLPTQLWDRLIRAAAQWWKRTT